MNGHAVSKNPASIKPAVAEKRRKGTPKPADPKPTDPKPTDPKPAEIIEISTERRRKATPAKAEPTEPKTTVPKPVEKTTTKRHSKDAPKPDQPSTAKAEIKPPTVDADFPKADEAPPKADEMSPKLKKRRPGRPCKYPKPAPEPRLGIAATPMQAGSLMELQTSGHKWIKRMLGAFQRSEYLIIRVDAEGMVLYPEDEKTQARFQGALINRFYAAPDVFCGRLSCKKLSKSLSGLDNSDHMISMTLRPSGEGFLLYVDVAGTSRRSQASLEVERADSPPELQRVWRIPSPREPPSLHPREGLRFDVAFRIPATLLKKVYNKFSGDMRTLQLTYEEKHIVFQQEKDDSRKEFVDRAMVELVVDAKLSPGDLNVMVTPINQQLLQAIIPTNNVDEESVIISSTRNGKLLIEKVDQTGGYGIRIGVGC